MDAMGFWVKETRRCLSAKTLCFNRSGYFKLIEPTYFHCTNRVSPIQLEKRFRCAHFSMCCSSLNMQGSPWTARFMYIPGPKCAQKSYFSRVISHNSTYLGLKFHPRKKPILFIRPFYRGRPGPAGPMSPFVIAILFALKKMVTLKAWPVPAVPFLGLKFHTWSSELESMNQQSLCMYIWMFP